MDPLIITREIPFYPGCSPSDSGIVNFQISSLPSIYSLFQHINVSESPFDQKSTGGNTPVFIFTINEYRLFKVEGISDRKQHVAIACQDSMV